MGMQGTIDEAGGTTGRAADGAASASARRAGRHDADASSALAPARGSRGLQGRASRARRVEQPGGRRATRFARGLGWFSLALGAAEWLLPGPVARGTGQQGREALVRGYGLREVVTGAALLNARDPTPWVWARVAGDVLDLATLATGLERGREVTWRSRIGLERRPAPWGTIAALVAVAGVTALDVACARALSENRRRNRIVHDYSDRSGLPRTAAEMRGAARHLALPRDMRTPEALRRLDRPRTP